MLTFLSLADSKKPRWIVWENVPGVLSSNGGRDFGTFLGALGKLGYGFAYRVLDAQYFGVAQRRRRVFVVGYLGDWRVAAAVLFERESLQRDIKPSRKKREEVTANAEGGVGESGIPRISNALCARDYKGSQPERNQGAPLIIDRAAFNQGENAQYEPRIEEGETMSSLVAKGAKSVAQPIVLEDQGGSVINASDKGIVGTLRAQTHGHEPAVLQPIAFKVRGGCEGGGKGYLGQEEQAFTIRTMQDQQIAQPIAVDWRTAQVDQGITQTLKTDLAKMSGPCIAVDVYNQNIGGQTSQTVRSQKNPTNIGAVLETMAIRRLTPKECERLQGFPDDFTKIPYRNKPADQCPDGPRYKACGNSMAVPVMRWIGQRIQLIDTILNK